MSPDDPKNGNDLADAALRVVGAWARFSKALAIYPETNVRVQTDLDGFLSSILVIHDLPHACRSGWLQIGFHGQTLIVDRISIEMETHEDLVWLKERFDKAMLAGVRIDRNVPPDSLLAFNKQLIAYFRKGDLEPDFARLWSERYQGFELFERRFDGRFVGGDLDDLENVQYVGEAGAATPADMEALTQFVLEDAGVVRRYESLASKLETITVDGESTLHLDVVGRLIRLLPADLLRDPKELIDAVKHGLEQLEGWVDEADGEKPSLGEGLQREQNWRRLLRRVGQRLYSRRMKDAEALAEEHRTDLETAEEPKTRGPTGHAGDEDFSENQATFLEAHADMRQRVAVASRLLPVEVPSEVLATLLHTLALTTDELEAETGTFSSSPIDMRNLAAHLKRILTAPDDACLRVLRQHLGLETCSTGQPTNPETRDRVVSFLGEHGLVKAMRDCGLLTHQWALQQFPRHFGLYLDALPMRDEDAAEELEYVGRALGAGRIVAAADALGTRHGLMMPGRMEKIFARDSKDLLPFLYVILLHTKAQYQDQVVDYLRRLRLRDPLMCLIWVIEDKHYIPRDYLLEILKPSEMRDPQFHLERRISLALVEYIRATEHRVMENQRRGYAILHLGQFQSSTAEVLLHELARPRRFWQRGPASIRRNAKVALKAYKGR